MPILSNWWSLPHEYKFVATFASMCVELSSSILANAATAQWNWVSVYWITPGQGQDRHSILQSKIDDPGIAP
jgi:hypothetical protein